MKIKKKVQANYFQDVLDGKKRFEIRLADFDCKDGDTIILQEQKQDTDKLTGRELECELVYKLNTKEVEKFYSKKDIEKYGLLILAIRKKYN